MKSRQAIILGAMAAFLGAAMAMAQGSDMVLLPDSAAMQWQKAPLVKGYVEISVLAGDLTKPAPFVLRVKLPANTVIPPHTHATAENLTMISGLIYHDMGQRVDEGSAKTISPGGFVHLPANMAHSLWTAQAPAEFEITGVGPFGLHYINPADDPSHTAK